MTLVQTELKSMKIGTTPIKRVTIRPNIARLPAEYQEVEYIQSSGTQYLVIGSSFKSSYKTVIDLQMTVIGGDYAPLGVRDSSNNKQAIDVYDGYFKIACGSNWTSTISENTNRHTITIDKNTATVDGTNYSISYVNTTFTTGIGVFAFKETSGAQYYSSNKLYKLDIYDENGVHIYDLIPCYRIADSVIGLYDLVNDVFYTNSGTGTFTKGADIPSQVEKQIRPIATTMNYTISNIPTDDSNTYVNVGQSGKTIQSVKFSFTATSSTTKYITATISSNNSNTDRYQLLPGSDGSGSYGNNVAIRGRLNSNNDTYYRSYPMPSGTYTVEWTINRDGNCTLKLNNNTYTYTAGAAELNVIQTVMNLSDMNVYASQNTALISGNKEDVEVTYS